MDMQNACIRHFWGKPEQCACHATCLCSSKMNSVQLRHIWRTWPPLPPWMGKRPTKYGPAALLPYPISRKLVAVLFLSSRHIAPRFTIVPGPASSLGMLCTQKHIAFGTQWMEVSSILSTLPFWNTWMSSQLIYSLAQSYASSLMLHQARKLSYLNLLILSSPLTLLLRIHLILYLIFPLILQLAKTIFC